MKAIMAKAPLLAAIYVVMTAPSGLQAAELSVGNLSISPGTTDSVIISGTVTNEITFGVTMLVEIVPQGGNTGSVTFTPSPPVDIVQDPLNDPWPSLGTFSAFDTDSPGFSSLLNAVVDDDGRFICDTNAVLSFSGPLVSIPVIASADASGVWNVVLSTSVGDSGWECIPATTLLAGTITVAVSQCTIDQDCNDGVACTDDTCVGGNCVATANNANCPDDGLFCNGAEVCDAVLDCVSTGTPCPGQACDEVGNVCIAGSVSLSVGSINVFSGMNADVVVSGDTLGQETFGMTILVEITSRVGNIGTVTFTNSPPVDIVHVGDPWPSVGTFTAFDTDSPGFSSVLNGAVDDDGRFICDVNAAVSFAGPLVDFPVAISAGASGVWDVSLATSAGNSVWECVGATALTSGTITVSPPECVVAGDCVDGIACTDDACVANACVHTPNDANCADDLIFCNGIEQCDVALDCVSSGDPCQPGEFCNEFTTTCDQCQLAADCNDGVGCTDDTCVAGSCVFTPNDANCIDDGLFCNGTELCDALQDCSSSGSPCLSSQVCDELNDVCTGCTTNAECDDGNVCTDDVCNVGVCEYTNNTVSCDDGLFCTATDVCNTGVCVGAGDRCPGQVCDEVIDICVPPPPSISVADLLLVRGTTDDVVVSGTISGNLTFGVTLLVEIVPRAGAIGTVVFSPSPPVDILQLGDPWPLAGTFTAFDTDASGFGQSLNGSVDDNGTFVVVNTFFSGALTAFPVTASTDAGGVWDVFLTTSVGDSGWEGQTTALNSGTISVDPAASLMVASRAMPPGSVVDVVVSGTVENVVTPSVNILLEILSRPGNTGTLEFTPPFDIVELGNPWGASGTFSAFDTGSAGFSATTNGTLHGTFSPIPLTFQGGLSAFPVVASTGANGVWDLVLVTSLGASGWQDTLTALSSGSITVSASSCLIDLDCDDGNSCTDDTCLDGTCQHATIIGACDDGDLCTINDTCQGTVCTGTPLDCSGLDDACHVGVCNAATGICETAPANDGGVCDDLDPCTEIDICSGGVCAGSPVDCSILNDTCNVGACNAITGVCEPTPTNNGGICDDGNLCTLNDACLGGGCLGTPLDCSALNNACNLGACNTVNGLCESVPFNEGIGCDDGDACTQNDLCIAGICAGTPLDCSSLTDACNNGVCNIVGGFCEAISTNDGGTCDDADPCTSGDTCSLGTCAGTAIPGCVNCVTDPQCDDGNFCTGETCVGGACQYTNLTVACDDGSVCTSNDVCSAGSCVGTPTDCSSLNGICRQGVCDATTGFCRPQPANEGGPCNDGFACTINDQCSSGTCGGTLTSPPAVDLTWSPASPLVQSGATFFVDLIATSGTCLDQAVGSIEIILNWNPLFVELIGKIDTGPISWLISAFPNDSAIDGLNAPFDGTLANDGDALYQALSAFQSGAFIPPAGVIVTSFEFRALDGTTGTPITISPTAGLFTRTRVIGAGADLGIDVTGSLGTASVQIAECQTNAECDDGNVCTNDACVSGVCQHNNNTASCNDGLFCTSNDTCSGGTCVGGIDPCPGGTLCSEQLNACVDCLSPIDCDDGNICTDEVCDAFGTCTNPNNNVSCDDGLFCTLTDTCSGGSCVGAGNQCPGQVCDEANSRCVDCLVNGDCNDGNVCTTDTCAGNLCTNAANTLPCNDGQFCTVTDTCVNATCVGVGNPCTAPLVCSEAQNQCVQCETNGDCDDGNLCTTDVCFLNVCTHTNNSLPCDDGLFCTTGDICGGGICGGPGVRCPGQLCDEPNAVCVDCFTLADCPDDQIACTLDACVNGACVHQTTDALCDDGLFCTGNEFCHQLLGCQSGASPCDDTALCVEANQSCGCQEPIVAAEGSRYVGVSPKPGQTPVALIVSGIDPSVGCVSLYAQSDGTLGVNPVVKPPTGPNGWNQVHIHGVEMIPETTYIVQTECDTGQGVGRSTPAQVTTWIWGDTDNSGGLVDIRDVTFVADGFRGDFSTRSLQNVDLWGATPDDCFPRMSIDLIDITKCLGAFQQFPYACDAVCP